jgi:hypothetical protein
MSDCCGCIISGGLSKSSDQDFEKKGSYKINAFDPGSRRWTKNRGDRNKNIGELIALIAQGQFSFGNRETLLKMEKVR